MDSAYYEAPTGSPERYAAYEKEFATWNGLGFPVPGDPEVSYEIDNAWELAYDDPANVMLGLPEAEDPGPEIEPEPDAGS